MNNLEKQSTPVTLQETKPKKKRLFISLPRCIDMSNEPELVKNLRDLQKTIGHKSIVQTLLFTARIYFKSQNKDGLLL